MNANTKANAELEQRPLEPHELEIVSGGVTTFYQSETAPLQWFMYWGFPWGPH